MHEAFQTVHHRQRGSSGVLGPITKTIPYVLVQTREAQYFVREGGVYSSDGTPIEPGDVPSEVISIIQGFSEETKESVGLLRDDDEVEEAVDDTRSQKIYEALISLDVDDDDLWTKNGQARVSVIETRVGFDINREELTIFDLDRAKIEVLQEDVE